MPVEPPSTASGGDSTASGGDNTASGGELAVERAAVARIRAVHDAELARVRARAAGLAEEAAAQTDDGIRDLVDPDAEVDAAVEAALVRQTSQRAIAAVRRAAELEARGTALAFGHITDKSGERLYIGRFSVIEGDEPLLVDWRARASVPFYRATPLDPLDVTRRRHLLHGDGVAEPAEEVVGYSDEVFDLSQLDDAAELRGEAALLASVTAPTPEQMRSAVATIQAEQDRVIRAPANGPLLVQGGPGTGKTVVALHRAAYLLYDQRDELADTGVLIVGPSPQFLRYVAGVLPSLGESGVVSLTVPELYVGIRRGHPEPAEVAEAKGRIEMVDLLASAVADRQRPPTEPLRLQYGSRSVTLGLDTLTRVFVVAQRHGAHNDGAHEFRRRITDELLADVYDPSFDNRADALAAFRSSRRLKRFLLTHFPPLTPEQALNDLQGSRALLRAAARRCGQNPADAEMLYRPRTPQAELESRRWSNADVPLLDELLDLLGGSMGQTEADRIAERDAADAFELAQMVDEQAPSLDIDPVERDDDPDDVEWMRSLDDPYFADQLADEPSEP